MTIPRTTFQIRREKMRVCRNAKKAKWAKEKPLLLRAVESLEKIQSTLAYRAVYLPIPQIGNDDPVKIEYLLGSGAARFMAGEAIKEGDLVCLNPDTGKICKAKQ